MTWPLSHPHPTTPSPDCDQVQPGSGTSETAVGPSAVPTKDDLGSANESVYDSCVDDLNSILGATPEPDPFLDDREPASTGHAGSPPVESDPKEVRQRTSEVFRAVLSQPTPVYADSWVATAAISADPEPAPAEPVWSARSAHVTSATPEEPGSAADDDLGDFGSMRSAWIQLVLASYASAVTLALVWVLWTGRSIQRPEAAAIDESSQTSVETGEARPVRKAADPPLPSANVTSIGKAIHLGDLNVTPVEISSGPVRLLRTVHPEQLRQPKDRSLILRLEFKNLAHGYSFAPLDREFVREPSTRIDDSYIEASDGTRTPLYPLAADSEWSITGQDFSPIGPGQSLETTLVSAAVDPATLGERLTWRIRLRTGLYSTTVLGVTFAKSDIKKGPSESH